MSELSFLKPVIWVGSSRKDLLALPDGVRDHFGYAIYVAQNGGKHRDAKSMIGLGSSGVVEVVSAVRFASAIYVLHVFQKKSKTGIETPKREIELIRQRLLDAEKIAGKGNK